MENASNNVTVMSQFRNGRGRTGQTGSDALDDCREMSTVRLSSALTEALQQAMGDLLSQAEKAQGYELYQLYIEAVELSRDRRPSIEVEFRKRYLQRFNRECRRERKREGGGSMEDTHLSLMEPADLETSLAATTLANAIYNACSEALFGLDKRMGLLINDPELHDGDNPLGPEVISAAVLDALIDEDAAIKVKLLLVSALNKHLPGRVRGIYQEINYHLVKRGVLPSIRVGMKRNRRDGGSEHPPTAVGQGGAGNQDLFTTLQQLMSLGRIGTGPTLPGMPIHPAAAGGNATPLAAWTTAAMPGPGTYVPGPRATASIAGGAAGGVQLPSEATLAGVTVGGMTMQAGGESTHSGGAPAFVQTLTRLQQGGIDGLTAGILNTAIGHGPTNVLREIRNSSLANSLEPLDVMTLDIVAMVFDYILDDRRIPDAMKALIGRLQIPVLKVAMLDKSFFTQKSHPARSLLDALAAASIGWDEEEGHDSGLYRKIDELVQFIVNHFEENFEVFAQALDALRGFLAEEKALIDRRTGESAQVLHAREHAEIARIVAHDEVQSHLVGQNAPGVIRTFLSDFWEALLVAHYQNEGEGSVAWSSALETMRDLIWSVSPKVRAEERKRLVGMLPKLLKRLDEGMKYMAVPNEERDNFFTSLVRCHAYAIKAGLQGGAGETATLDVGTAETEIKAAEPRAAPPAVSEFEPITLPAVPPIPDPALLVEISEPMDAFVANEVGNAASPWAELELEGNQSAKGEETLRRLKRGTWIELQQEDGSVTRVKLSWVSPLKGIYLFTNRVGKRAISISADGLAAKCRAGKVSIIDNIPLMDRAVSNLLEKLQQNASS